MKHVGQYVFTVAKYVVLMLTAGYIALLLFAGVSRKSFDEVSAAVSSAVDTNNLSGQDSQALKRNFGLNSSEYSGVLYYASASGISAEEVLLIQVADSSQISQVTDALEEHVESRQQIFEGYAPEQARLLESARQSVRGSYIFFAVSENAFALTVSFFVISPFPSTLTPSMRSLIILFSRRAAASTVAPSSKYLSRVLRLITAYSTLPLLLKPLLGSLLYKGI